MLKSLRRTLGFTLIELSVVLLIIGAVMSGGFVLLGAQIKTKQFNSTVARMEKINNALLNYTISFGRLPCPASLTLATTDPNYGKEAASNGNTCLGGTPSATNSASTGTVEGAVPFVALRLSESDMYDAWGRKFRYAINPSKTASASFPPSSGTQCSDTKNIRVNDATGAARTSYGVYSIISHGANGHGGYTRAGVMYNSGSTNTDELTNCHCTSAAVAGTYTGTYVQKMPTNSSSTVTDNFDDIVVFRDAWQLQSINVAMSNTGCPYLYVVDKGNNRIQKFDLDGNFIAKFGSAGTGNGQFDAPMGIFYDGTYLWVTDSNNARVQKFTLDGTFVSKIDYGGTCGGTGSCPYSVTVDGSGNIWVLSYYGNFKKYNSSGVLQGTYGGWGTADGQIRGGRCIQADSSNNIWIADYDSRIQKFDSNGNFVSKFTGYTNCTQMVFDASGNMWYTEVQYGPVRKYNPTTGALLQSVGGYWSTPPNPGYFDFPSGLAFSSAGDIYVADGHNYSSADLINKFNSAGTYQMRFGTTGSGDGQLNMPQNMVIVTSR